MAIKTKTGYACAYCKKNFKGLNALQEAENHKDSHNLIYLAISQEDLNNLVNFVFTHDERLLKNNIVDRLQKYLKTAFKFELEKGRDNDRLGGM
jgi:hypothetical protein